MCTSLDYIAINKILLENDRVSNLSRINVYIIT